MEQQFVTDFEPRPIERAWRMKRRPWWACCYAGPAAHFDHKNNRWVIAPNPWTGDTREWHIVMIKTFRTHADANNSHSLQRMYAPFNNPNSLVVLRYRQNEGLGRLVQYKLYGKKEGHS